MTASHAGVGGRRTGPGPPRTDSGVLRVGNASGFYGDRFDALREMLTGGPLDVLTGDYLAELTMLILGRDRMKDPGRGYARTFLRQLEDGLGLAREKGVALVTNAGGLNPAGLAEAVGELAERVGVPTRVAYVEGDDVLGRGGWGEGVLTANAYLGGGGIAACLRAGADVVVTGRVTDAALVSGAAAAHFGWSEDDHDALAGAVVAGHVLECGAQATGGNYALFLREGLDVRRPGFPLAEIRRDGSSVITKHPGTGGAVTVGTVTAQLLYETDGPRYAGPDVTARLDTVRLTQDGPDRVRIGGVQGEPPPPALKVGLTRLGGFRNEVVFVLTGLDVEEKAQLIRRQMEAQFAAAPGGPPQEVRWTLARTDREDADVQEEAGALLRLVVRDPDEARVGRAVSGAAVELALASYPGFHVTAPPGKGSPYGVFEAAYVPAADVPHTAVLPDGRRVDVPPPARTRELGEAAEAQATQATQAAEAAEAAAGGVPSGASPLLPPPLPPLPPLLPPLPEPYVPSAGGRTRRVPLGRLVGARSGDKGGSANVGVWVPEGAADGAAADDVWRWLVHELTVDRLRELLPETAGLPVTRHVLPRLRALNFRIDGILGEGVAAQARFDPQGKALGEWLRSRHVQIPEELL